MMKIENEKSISKLKFEFAQWVNVAGNGSVAGLSDVVGKLISAI